MNSTQTGATLDADRLPTAARTAHPHRLVKLMVATLTTAALTATMSSVAGATGTVSPAPFSCSAGGVLTVSIPRISTYNSRPEAAYQRLFLHRYQNGGWEAIAAKNWGTAMVTNQGYAANGWLDNVTFTSQNPMQRFTGLTAGFYAVSYAAQWGDGTKVSAFIPSWNNPSLGYCQFS